MSLAALIRRAHDLGCISDRQYRTFNIELNKLPGGRKREPGEFEPERPQLIKYLVDYYKDELSYSNQDLRAVLVVTEQRLRIDYFDEPSSPVRPMNQNRTLHSVPLHSLAQG